MSRISSPAATLERLRGRMGALGITRVADVTGLDNIGVPVVMVVRPNSRSLVVSQGKGIAPELARISGLMEAAESYHAERLDFPVLLARYGEIAARAADPATLPRAVHSHFTPELRIPWVEAVDIVGQTTKLVPLELVHTDYTLPLPPGSGCFLMSSNGLAAGNSLAEALVHGIAEVTERDAYALFRASSGASGQAVDLGSIDDPTISLLIEKIESAGCELLVEDITSDIGVPVFMATIRGGGGGSLVTCGPSGGLGCHPSRVSACLAAIVEAAQSRLTRISGSRDDLDEEAFRPMPETAVLPAAVKRFADGPGFDGNVAEEHLGWLRDRLRDAGFGAILTVDLTRPEIGIPVVRAIVPGLEGLPTEGCAPGARALHARRPDHRVPRS